MPSPQLSRSCISTGSVVFLMLALFALCTLVWLEDTRVLIAPLKTSTKQLPEKPSSSDANSAPAAAAPDATTTTTTATSSLTPTSSSPRRYAVVATSFNDQCRYSASAPLTAYIWARHVGATPIVLVPGPLGAQPAEGDNSPEAKARRWAHFAAAFIRSTGGHVVEVAARPADVARPTTVLQTARLAAFALGFLRPQDVVLTSDADLWPLDDAFWRAQLQPLERADAPQPVFIYNGPFYHSYAAHAGEGGVALSCVGAAVRTWQSFYSDFFKLPPGELSSSSTPPSSSTTVFEQVLDRMLAHGKASVGAEAWARLPPTPEQAAQQGIDSREAFKYCPQWFFDQLLATAMLQPVCPARCAINMRVDRLDRSSWPAQASPARTYTDSHILFPVTDGGVWGRLEPVWADMGLNVSAARHFLKQASALCA